MNKFTIEIPIESTLALLAYVYHSKNYLDDYYSFCYDASASFGFYLAILATVRNFSLVPMS
jgi:hypothetical protein